MGNGVPVVGDNGDIITSEDFSESIGAVVVEGHVQGF